MPYGRLQAGSSWRGGGAAAGEELPCFLSLSQSPESAELEFHVQSLAAITFSGLVISVPPQQRGVDQIGFLDLQPARLLPSPSLREFLCRVLFPSSTLHQGASQPGAAGNNWSSALCLLGGQAAVLWLTKFTLWLLCQTKECF